jgi:hypothetical protein
VAERDYSAVPLATKLGLAPGKQLFVSVAPNGPLRAELGTLLRDFPPARHPKSADVQLIFTTSRATLAKQFAPRAKALPPHGGLWIAWPKKASGIRNDLTFDTVQRIGLDAGLVDNKSIAVDGRWQAVRFVWRVQDRPSRR